MKRRQRRTTQPSFSQNFWRLLRYRALNDPFFLLAGPAMIGGGVLFAVAGVLALGLSFVIGLGIFITGAILQLWQLPKIFVRRSKRVRPSRPPKHVRSIIDPSRCN